MVICLVLLFQLAVLCGCVVGPAPYLPQDWISHPGAFASIGTNPQSKLQVIVTYSGFESSHSALRLVTSDGGVTFWDPGGDYGRFDDDWNAQFGPWASEIERDNDLILSNPPDIGMFVRWRWTLEDTSVEVFEWDISESRAQELQRILLHGTDDTHPAGSFSSWTFPLFCTMATSDFLRRFASPMIQLPERYFFPDNLAEALYTQAPSRVRVFTWDGQKTVYTPPGPKSVRQ